MNQPVDAAVSLDQRFAANSSGHPRERAAETDPPLWAWESDATGRFTRLEVPAGLIPCFSVDTVLGARLWDLPFLNMAAADWEAWRQATACGAALGPLDLLCAMPAGRPVWVRLNGSALSDAAPEAGGMAGHVGTFEDITCAMLAKSSPATREPALQEMLDALGIQICALDREGRIVALNRAWHDGSKSPAAQSRWTGPGLSVIGRYESQQARGDVGAATILASIRALLADGGATRVHEILDANAAQPVWWRITVSACGHGSAAVVLMREDISAQKSAEQAQRRSALQLRLLTEHIPEVFWIVDVDRREHLYVSPAYEKVWRRSLDSLKISRSSWKRAVHADDLPLVHGPARGLGTQQRRRAYRIVWPDGSIRWILEHMFAVPATASDAHLVIGIAKDITDERAAEAAMRDANRKLERAVVLRTRELEATNRELGTFAGTVSHDLHAPVRAIEGFTRILIEEHQAALNSDARNLLQRVVRAASRMSGMIDGLLELSRVGHRPLEMGVVDLSQMAADVMADLGSATHAEELTIAANLDAHGDATLLWLVLQNLLSNARKFSAGAGVAQIEFGAQLIDGLQVFFVRDNGVGFALAFARDLFQPFRRIHEDTQFKGTGLGLYTVRRIVERHGGQVWARSQPGQGATFYFTLGIPP